MFYIFFMILKLGKKVKMLPNIICVILFVIIKC